MTAPNGPILFNSSSGSDTAASGLGPSTAVSGTGASLDSTSTVDLSADTPDLSGVSAGDLLWVDTTSGRQFSIISSVDDGADTVTCDDAYGVTEGSRNWGIGGKRLSIDGSSQLINGGSADIKAGWIVELGDGFDETMDGYNLNIDGDTTNGPITIRGENGASTRPVLKVSAFSNGFTVNGDFWVFKGFKLLDTGSGARALRFESGGPSVVDDMVIDGWNTTGIQVNGDSAVIIKDSDILNNNSGISVADFSFNVKIIRSKIHDNTNDGIDDDASAQGSPRWWVIKDSFFYSNGGKGIAFDDGDSRDDAWGNTIVGNVFYDNTSDGIFLGYAADSMANFGDLIIEQNIFSSNGGYGINISNGDSENLGTSLINNNAFYNNTSGEITPDVDTGGTTLTADPFVDAANDDFNINDTAGGGAALRSATVTI